MDNDTNFLNNLKIDILNVDITTNNDNEQSVINFFFNSTIKCLTLNEIRDLIDVAIYKLKIKNSYSNDMINFFSKIKRSIIIYDLKQIYDDSIIELIKNKEFRVK